MVIIFIIKK